MFKKVLPLVVCMTLIPGVVLATQSGHGDQTHFFAVTFAILALLLVCGKVSGSLISKLGHPIVLGEILIGVILGNLALFNINFFRGLEHNTLLAFFAQLGVLILLFQIGLESNLADIKKVGAKATGVAIIGMVLPYTLGTFVAGPLLLPGLSMLAYSFLGATLTATSVGITGRVLRDMGQMKKQESRIILSAAVIDDVMGLLILAVLSAVAVNGMVSFESIFFILVKVVIFLVGGIVLGKILAPYVTNWFSKIHEGIGMKFTFVLAVGLFFAYLAHKAGLEPIIGAFVAGLILDPVYFKRFKGMSLVRDIQAWLKKNPERNKESKKAVRKILDDHSHHHVEELIENISYIFVPIFFIYTGLQVRLEVLLSPRVLALAVVVTILAVLGKAVSGMFLPKFLNKWLVGFGMAPRGEVCLIFAGIGRSFNVINDEIFSIIVIMIILTTIFTPIILTKIIKKEIRK